MGPRVKTYKDRSDWILDYLDKRSTDACPFHCDVLDTDFVNGYIEFSGAKRTIQFFGAPKCSQLGRDLSKMYGNGILNRSRCGLNVGDAAMGFPKWVYCYELPDYWFKL